MAVFTHRMGIEGYKFFFVSSYPPILFLISSQSICRDLNIEKIFTTSSFDAVRFESSSAKS
jgi:hypothetical protein